MGGGAGFDASVRAGASDIALARLLGEVRDEAVEIHMFRTGCGSTARGARSARWWYVAERCSVW
jgi:hypothetical protein